MDNDLMGILAALVAAAGAIVAGVQRQVVLALVAAAVSLFALADVVKAL